MAVAAISLIERHAEKLMDKCDDSTLERLMSKHRHVLCDGDFHDDLMKQLCYIDLVENEGVDPVFAVMTATKRSPGADTDREFLDGHTHGRFLDGMSDRNRTRILEMAKRNGINVNSAVHKAGLGPPSDPRAWVSSKADVLRTCQEKGLSCTGAVEYTHPTPPVQKKALSETIINRRVAEQLRDPKTAEAVKKKPSKINELREKVIAKHGKKRK